MRKNQGGVVEQRGGFGWIRRGVTPCQESGCTRSSTCASQGVSALSRGDVGHRARVDDFNVGPLAILRLGEPSRAENAREFPRLSVVDSAAKGCHAIGWLIHSLFRSRARTIGWGRGDLVCRRKRTINLVRQSMVCLAGEALMGLPVQRFCAILAALPYRGVDGAAAPVAIVRSNPNYTLRKPYHLISEFNNAKLRRRLGD